MSLFDELSFLQSEVHNEATEVQSDVIFVLDICKYKNDELQTIENYENNKSFIRPLNSDNRHFFL